jgi:hypothetical protein
MENAWSTIAVGGGRFGPMSKTLRPENGEVNAGDWCKGPPGLHNLAPLRGCTNL